MEEDCSGSQNSLQTERLRRRGRGGGGNKEERKKEKENHDAYCPLGCDAEYKRCFG